MNLVDGIVILFLVVTFPIGVYVFSKQLITLRGVWKMCCRYDVHFYLLFGIFMLKTLVFYVEGPAEGFFSMDLTQIFHDAEGNKVFWIQHTLYNPFLTTFLCAIYVASFMFIYTFSFTLFAYLDRIKLASRVIFLHLVLLLVTIPFYLFVIVYVPSYPKMLYPGAESVIKGIEPLLYNYSPRLNHFFVDYDTFNNCFPSMHVAYPVAILLLLMRRTKEFTGYKVFLAVITALIMLAVLYLGIHWLLDVFGGIVIAALCVALAEKYNDRFWRRVWRYKRAYDRKFEDLKARIRGRSGEA